jgi:hypothetical protein
MLLSILQCPGLSLQNMNSADLEKLVYKELMRFGLLLKVYVSTESKFFLCVCVGGAGA